MERAGRVGGETRHRRLPTGMGGKCGLARHAAVALHVRIVGGCWTARRHLADGVDVSTAVNHRGGLGNRFIHLAPSHRGPPLPSRGDPAPPGQDRVSCAVAAAKGVRCRPAHHPVRPLDPPPGLAGNRCQAVLQRANRHFHVELKNNILFKIDQKAWFC